MIPEIINKQPENVKDVFYMIGINKYLKMLFYVAREKWEHPQLNYTITCGLRSQKEQELLYKAGRTKVLIGAPHVEGRAVDVCMILAGKVTWERPYYIQFYQFMDSLFRNLQAENMIPFEYSLIWGGDWNNNKKLLEHGNWEVDLTHYEIQGRAF
jgi:hypothetical protein